MLSSTFSGSAACPPADALSSSSTSDLGESARDAAKGAATDLKAKAKSVIKGNSALPNSTATVADLNADVRGLAENYRDPAGAIQQDKAAGGWAVALCFVLCLITLA
jgi:hypothetical protein